MKYTFNQGENAGGESTRANANNFRAVRFADILLLRAEVAVEENGLPTALDLVNQVRDRADNCVVTLPDGTPAAKYVVGLYTSFPGQQYARQAVQFERRLGLALEGQRFFDLVRWNIAAETLNAYLPTESTKRTYLNGATFEKGKDEYFPIPQTQIDIVGADILKQNPL